MHYCGRAFNLLTTSGAYCKASRRDDGRREGLRLSFWDKCGSDLAHISAFCGYVGRFESALAYKIINYN